MKHVSRKAVCLHFEVHQPFRLKSYRFFDLGHDHYYYDDYANESIMQRIAARCYIPANKILLDLIRKHKGKFKVAFSISGLALDQFSLYTPEVIDSFRQLAATGSVEFLAETNSHSLASLKSREEFEKQVNQHTQKMKDLLGVEPTAIRNTEMIYSDQIGAWMADMGFRVTLTEGAKHVLGWKSPNFVYCNSINPRLKVLLRNFVLSDDIAFRFSNRDWCEWPLTASKYAGWISQLASSGEVVNIFIDYETFGEHHRSESGIMDFLAHFPGAVLKSTPFVFMTPTEVADHFQPIAPVQVPSPISWADEERDLTAWLGNELQTAAFEKLYDLSERINTCAGEELKKDWVYLQSSDHFYYMCTKFFSDGAVHAYFNPYETPYDAFMNYMNILSDFELRINREAPCSEEFNIARRMKEAARDKDFLIENLQRELDQLRKKVRKPVPAKKKPVAKKAAVAKKVPAKKAAAAKKVPALKKAAVKRTAGKQVNKK
ncbi:MAG: alpha-amylase [Bacteroidetes bacterium]|nr:alpha-amylase [Bacteroidota bacterium]